MYRRPLLARRRVRWLVGPVLVALLAVVVHYWPGRGWLSYVGVDTSPIRFDMEGSGRRTLTVPQHEVPGVPNFARVSGDLYRGGQPTAEGFAELKRMGVRTIVNLRETRTDRLHMRGLGLQYVHLRMNPTGPTDEEVAAFLTLFEDPRDLPLFVHCHMGADRTGACVAVYRVMYQGWSMDQAVKELPLFGFHDVWSGLLDYLAAFDPDAMAELMDEAPPAQIEVVD